MGALLRAFVLVLIAALAVYAAPRASAAQASAEQASNDSSITIVNRTHNVVSFRLRVAGEPEWEAYDFEPEEESDIGCDGCQTRGFEIEIGKGAPHRYFLQTGKTFAIDFNGSWVVYFARPEPVIPDYYADID